MTPQVSVTEAVQLAIIASVVGPLTMSWLTARQRRLEKAEDYKRQDEVADRARQAEEAASMGRKEVARLLETSNRESREATALHSGKLEQIHKLVNSSLTESLQAELRALKHSLALLNEIVALRIKFGDPPRPSTQVAIDMVTRNIKEAESKLKDRGDPLIAEENT